jgi:ankyrin repeat protein
MAACENGHLEVAKEHLAQGADVNAKTNKGTTPLRAAPGTNRQGAGLAFGAVPK